MAAPHRSHQISVQDFVNLSSTPPLAETVRIQAEERFHTVVDHFTPTDEDSASYNRPKLVGLVYRYAISPKSKDNVLLAFFRATELSMEGGPVDFSDATQTDALRARVVGFAEYLVNNFFMPLRASTAQTPQPTPHFRSATMRSSSRDFIGTTGDLSALRGDCLVRDRHRCVVSRDFDMDEANKRATPDGEALDDDGNPILNDDVRILEVAHILPHSLVQVGSESEELVCAPCPWNFLHFYLFCCCHYCHSLCFVCNFNYFC